MLMMVVTGKDRCSYSCPYSFSFSYPFSSSSHSPFSFPPLVPFPFSSTKSAENCERFDRGKRFRDPLTLPYRHYDSFFLLLYPHHESSPQHCSQKGFHRSKSTAPHSHANDDFPPILPRALSVLSFSRANPPTPLVVVIGQAGPEEQTQSRGGGGGIYVGAVAYFLFFLSLVPPRAPFSLLVIGGLVKGVRPRIWTRGTRRWRTRR